MGIAATDAELAAVLATLDVDGDGAVSYCDFASALTGGGDRSRTLELAYSTVQRLSFDAAIAGRLMMTGSHGDSSSPGVGPSTWNGDESTVGFAASGTASWPPTTPPRPSHGATSSASTPSACSALPTTPAFHDAAAIRRRLGAKFPTLHDTLVGLHRGCEGREDRPATFTPGEVVEALTR